MASANTETSTPLSSLLTGYNLPVDFSTLTEEGIQQATVAVLDLTRKSVSHIKSLAGSKHFDQTFGVMDDMYNSLGRMHNLLDLISNTHPDESLRRQAMKSLAETGKMFNAISLDTDLYRALKPVYDEQPLTGWQARLAEKIIRSFERNGCNLGESQRTELKKIKDRISDLSIEFSNNIDSEHHEFRFSADEVSGLPESYLEPRRQPDGTFLVTLDYPDYHPFMKYCSHDAARKKLYMAFTTRAHSNREVLKNLIDQRHRMALLTGYSSYARFSLDDNVAKNPEAVWQFEKTLNEKVRKKAEKDYALLMEIKFSETRNREPLQPWQTAYYTEKLLLSKYQLDSEKLKEYFPLEAVLDGIFTICSKLFGISIVEKDNSKTWHSDARYFEVMRDGSRIAHFYLDLFPRKNKFSHAACFGITSGKLLNDGTYQQPSAALVCNFPKPTDKLPSLLTHDDVETLFHEFGHLMHHLLTRSPVYYFAGTNTAIDFVEVPSQLFENWAWDYESLVMFARHYRTGQVLPPGLFNSMMESRNVNSGIFILQQVFYASLDMTYHDGFDVNTRSTTDVVRELQNEITLFPYVEGTHFETSFGHLKDYAAGYYSYMWARVYADDMYFEIKKSGLMNPDAGRKYLKEVLEKGATEDESELVRKFLGREPRFDAFLRHNGIE